MSLENKTIEQIENNYWGEPPIESSSLVKKCHYLRKKKLKDFTIEDLRLMIGQDSGLKYLIPKAIKILQENPFVEGDFYPGDLLKSVLTSERTFWNDNQELKIQVINIFNLSEDEFALLELSDDTKQELEEAYDDFRR